MAFEVPSRPAVRPRSELKAARATRALINWAIEHPILFTMLTALAVRSVVAVGVFLFRDGALFLDDRTYNRLAAQAAAGHSATWNSFERHIFHSTLAYTGTLSVLYRIFGSSALVGQLFTAMLGTLTAGAVAALALDLMPRRNALVAGLAAALFPSQVLWSSLALKDAGVWASLASLALAVHAAVHATSRGRLAFAGGSIVALLVILGNLRIHTTVVAAWALALTAIVVRARHPAAVRCVFIAVAVLVPVSIGLGPLGYKFVHENAGDLAVRRSQNAYGAATALVRPSEPRKSSPSPQNTSSQSTPPTSEHKQLPAQDDVTVNLRYLPHGLAAMLIRPTPWSTRRTLGLALANVEALLWYPLLVAAAAGLPAAWRRRDILAFPVIVGSGIIALYSLSEGNLGTAYRHRGEFVWVVLLLAAFGITNLIDRLSRPSQEVFEDRAA